MAMRSRAIILTNGGLTIMITCVIYAQITCVIGVIHVDK
jgi:hypothetical protein